MQSVKCEGQIQPQDHRMNMLVSVDLVRAAKRSESIPEKWDNAKIARAVDRYERFLKLAVTYPDSPVAPTRDIDLIWHLHMQHPAAYYNDCMRLFARIFDHDGGFGSEPAELPELQRNFLRTAERWRELYHEDYVQSQDADAKPVKCWHDCESRCWHACESLQ